MSLIAPELASEVLKRALSRGGEFADLFAEWRAPTSLVVERDVLEKCLTGTEGGIGLRLVFNEKTAFAYSNDLSRSSLMEMADTLRAAVKEGPPSEDFNFERKRPEAPLVIERYPHQVDMSEKIGLITGANRTARSLGNGIKQVSVIYRDYVQKVLVAVSDGTLVEDERVQSVAVINVIAERDGVIQTGFEAVGGHMGFEIFDEGVFDEASLKAGKRALMMLGAKRAPGGRMPVIISSEAGGTMIHEAVGHGLEADLARQGLSVYSGSMGKKIASELVTVVDSATLSGKRGSFNFDDEGVRAHHTVAVKDGVLQSFLYDRYSALREKTGSTGNGRRESYRHRPIPRMTNTFIDRGGHDASQTLSETPTGLFVKAMGGGQVNTVTGEFVFDVQEAYLIENGALGQPVRGATLTGSGPEVLNSIDRVCTDLGFSIGTCGKDSQGVPVSDAMPTIRIPEMVVGGQV